MVEKIEATTVLHLPVTPGRNKSIPIHLDILMSGDDIHVNLNLIDHRPGVNKLKSVSQTWPAACFYQ